jgi:hypothetical protein
VLAPVLIAMTADQETAAVTALAQLLVSHVEPNTAEGEDGPVATDKPGPKVGDNPTPDLP